MTVAVISANIGSIDEVYPMVKQSCAYDVYYFTENTLPFPLPELNNRMKGKYFKTQAHRFIDADIIIWIDGSIEVINPDFIKDIISMLNDTNIVMTQHTQRDSVYKELEYIIEKIKAGDRYLMKRYVKQPLYQEYQYYKNQGLPKTYPLYNCFFFAYKPTPSMSEMFNDWWDHILRYSNFDQSQFAYVAWKHNVAVKTITANDHFIRHKHNGYNL